MRTVPRALALLGAAALLFGTAGAASAETGDAVAVAVADCDGVTVIVDFTDLGGAVESGCAEGDPASGREALETAGFTAVNDPSGFICTIDSQPDPCPTEFTGSYWAYWQVVDGEWVASQVGADEADPAPGDLEGWRYNDGSVPPPLPAADGETADPTTDPVTTAPAESDSENDGGGISPALWTVLGVVVVALVAGLVIRRGRSSSS